MTLERRYRVSLIVYALLAIAIWFSMSGESFQVRESWISFRVSFRAIALVILGLFAFKTLLHRKAEQIRGSGDEVAGRE
jgi:hypothetical protein